MKKLFHIKSDSLPSAEQALVLKLGDRYCSFAITTIEGEQSVQAVYYTAGEINESSLATLFVNHPELNNSFSKVILCYDFPGVVLIPRSYFNPGNSLNLLKTVYGFKDRPEVNAQLVPGQELYILYAVPKKLNEWLTRKFPSAGLFHHYSSFIQNLSAGENIWIDFRTDEFSLVAAKENRLLLAQTFLYSNPDDVIYYLLKTARQFSLSPKEVRINLSGLIEKESALFRELYQYFLHLEFRNTNWQAEYPSHFFTSLKDLVQCAS